MSHFLIVKDTEARRFYAGMDSSGSSPEPIWSEQPAEAICFPVRGSADQFMFYLTRWDREGSIHIIEEASNA